MHFEQRSRLTHPAAFREIGMSGPKMNTEDPQIIEHDFHERTLQGGIRVPLMVRDLYATEERNGLSHFAAQYFSSVASDIFELRRRCLLPEEQPGPAYIGG
jgi:hypothetical protein